MRQINTLDMTVIEYYRSYNTRCVHENKIKVADIYTYILTQMYTLYQNKVTFHYRYNILNVITTYFYGTLFYLFIFSRLVDIFCIAY